MQRNIFNLDIILPVAEGDLIGFGNMFLQWTLTAYINRLVEKFKIGKFDLRLIGIIGNTFRIRGIVPADTTEKIVHR